MKKEDILKYEKLVYKIIYDLSGKYNEDLYQVGMLALLEAYKNYNKVENAKFSSYAYLYILGRIAKSLRENKTIKISRDIIKLNKTIEKGKELLRQKLCREPSVFEVSVYLEIDINTIMEVENATKDIKSLDSYMNDEEEINYYNSVKVYDKETESEYLDLKDALNNLDIEERKIIYDRYYNGYTQQEISKNLGISQVQVSRKESKILQKLKENL